jgi:hypothetical protein
VADNTWKLLLEADDRILETVEADIKKLDELAAAVGKIPTINVTSNVRQVVAQDSAAIDGLKAKAQAGIQIEAIKSTVSPLQEASLGRLYRGAPPGGANSGPEGNSPWDRVIGKAMPGGGLGNAIGGALGGSLAASLGVGLAFAAFGAIKSSIQSAQTRDLASQAEMKQIERTLEVSKGSTEALARLGNAIETLGLIAAKVLGEVLGKLSGGFQVAAGAVASGIGRVTGWDKMSAAGDSLLTSGVASFMGGTGDSDVVAAEARLDKAKKARKERQSRSEGMGAPEAIQGIPVDEMARRGLFVGSSSGQSVQELLRQNNTELKTMREVISRLPAGIAENL